VILTWVILRRFRVLFFTSALLFREERSKPVPYPSLYFPASPLTREGSDVPKGSALFSDSLSKRTKFAPSEETSI